MTECVHKLHFLSEHLEGELLPTESQDLERSLKACTICQQELRILRQTVDALQQLPLDAPPADFLAKLRRRMEQREVEARHAVEQKLAAPPWAALVEWVFGLGQCLLFPLHRRIPICAGVVALAVVTVLWRASPEKTTVLRVLPMASAPLHSEALPQRVNNVAKETNQVVDTTGATRETLLPAAAPPPPPPRVQCNPDTRVADGRERANGAPSAGQDVDRSERGSSHCP